MLLKAAVLLALAPRAALAQTCDPCGESATYTETLSWMNGYRRRRIAAAGCPNHYSYPPCVRGLAGSAQCLM